jgi:hypothetical protein
MSENNPLDTIHDDDLADEALDREVGVKFAGCVKTFNSFAPTNCQ